MFMPEPQGPPIVMDEIPRTYYPGRGMLTDRQAYPTDIYGNPRMPELSDFENPFYRTPRYGGGLNIPGAPGNIQNFLYRTATPSFEIPGGQTPYRRGPYLPFEDIPEENEPFIPLPLAAVGRDQQPAQGPFTPIRNYPGMGYGPYGPGGGGMTPVPMRQAFVPPMGFQNKFVS